MKPVNINIPLRKNKEREVTEKAIFVNLKKQTLAPNIFLIFKGN